MEQANGNTPVTDPNVQTTTEPGNKDTLPTQSVDSQALQNELERERARAKTAQQEAERLRKEIRSFQLKGSQPQIETDNQEPALNYQAPSNNAANVKAELERGIYKMMLENRDYNEVLESDKTLKTFFEKDPLSVVSSDPINVDDALYQMKRFFDDKVYENKIKNLNQLQKTDELSGTKDGNQPSDLGNISQADFSSLDEATQKKLFEASTKKYFGL